MGQPPEKIGPYDIISPLGAGGMGQVYRARDTRLNREVALKVLPAEFSSDPMRKARFEQEAKAVAALNHPGIVAIYDVGDGWMVTELVEGQNLRQTGFTVKQVVDIGAQIADALAAAHDAGIAHRDLKPGNIMLTPQGVIGGKVEDEDGDPLAFASVTVYRRGYQGGQKQLVRAGAGTSAAAAEFVAA